MAETLAPAIQPGVHDGISQVDYIADPVPGGSLSATGIKRLLECPARYRWDTDHGGQTSPAMDLGSAAHSQAFGVGAAVHVTSEQEWRTAKVKDEIKEAKARGDIVIRPSELDAVEAMAKALREHPVASALFDRAYGKPEQTIVWRDGIVMLRSRLDWLEDSPRGRFFLVPDYKTCTDASPATIEKAIGRFGYHIQGAMQLAAVRSTGRVPDDVMARFLLVFQETRPPYIVTVAEPDATAMRLGAIRMREGINRYIECTRAGRWPGYSEDVVLSSLPPWETRELDGAVW